MNQYPLHKYGRTGGLNRIAKMLTIDQIDDFFKISTTKSVRDVGSGGYCYPPPEIYHDSDSDECNKNVDFSDNCDNCYHLKNNCVCVRKVEVCITGIRVDKSIQCDL